MSNSVIVVDNLSKQYRLGEVGTGTLSHDLNRWWHLVRGRTDPYETVGEENDRSVKGLSEYVWSLKDVSFEVKQGEVLGIIGKNGAGKSTLLKILSRTTTPTKGSVKLRGKVASLLEVGTGFHPELSGRDNIYLNGAILGMSKSEIKSKFDEILDFADVDRYIDTPVKRYSSGMYVRLAFAVAAHLDPEILIVDEVLAVGDAEFQQKCLGKMRDVSTSEGKTILFVSHNMSAIRNLCNRVIHLKNGKIHQNGETVEVVNNYLTESSPLLLSRSLIDTSQRSGSGLVQFCGLEILDKEGKTVSTVLTGDKIALVFKLKTKAKRVARINLGFSFHNQYDEVMTALYSSYQGLYFDNMEKEKFEIICEIPDFPFSAGSLIVRGRIEVEGEESDWPSDPLGFINVETGDFYRTSKIESKIHTPFLIKGNWASTNY
jgi:lipopolysaccharide transport system ATP-binding protein